MRSGTENYEGRRGKGRGDGVPVGIVRGDERAKPESHGARCSESGVGFPLRSPRCTSSTETIALAAGAENAVGLTSNDER